MTINSISPTSGVTLVTISAETTDMTVPLEELLKQFKSLMAIGKASLPELERMLPKDAAMAVYQHFHEEKGE